MITYRETIPDDNDDIQSFLLDKKDDFVDILHTEDNTEEFLEPELAELDDLLTTMGDPAPPSTTFNLISTEEMRSSPCNLTISSAPNFATVLKSGKDYHLLSTTTESLFTQATREIK